MCWVVKTCLELAQMWIIAGPWLPPHKEYKLDFTIQLRDFCNKVTMWNKIVVRIQLCSKVPELNVVSFTIVFFWDMIHQRLVV